LIDTQGTMQEQVFPLHNGVKTIFKQVIQVVGDLDLIIISNLNQIAYVQAFSIVGVIQLISLT